jgi:hypothetical protein
MALELQKSSKSLKVRCTVISRVVTDCRPAADHSAPSTRPLPARPASARPDEKDLPWPKLVSALIE